MKTQKEIFEAANAILAEGGSPTVATVRAKLGSGSYSTIGPALKLWRVEQAGKQPKEAAPPPVPETVTAHMRALWDDALSLARAGLQAERERLAIERREIERERQEAGELADQLEAELDEARARIVRLEGADRRLEEVKAMEAAALDEAARMRAQAEMARESREEAARQAEQYRKEAERYKLAEQACQARLESAAREMDDLRQRVKEAEARALKAAEEAAELRGRLGVYTSIQEQLAGVAQQQEPTDPTSEAAPVPRQDAGAGEFDEVVYNGLVEAGLGQGQFAAALADANLATLREALNDESIPPARLDRIKARVRELTEAQAAAGPTLADLMDIAAGTMDAKPPSPVSSGPSKPKRGRKKTKE